MAYSLNNNNIKEQLKIQKAENQKMFNEYIFYRAVKHANITRVKDGKAPYTHDDIVNIRKAVKDNIINRLVNSKSAANKQSANNVRSWSEGEVIERYKTEGCAFVIGEVLKGDTHGKNMFASPENAESIRGNKNIQVVISDFAKQTGLFVDKNANINDLWNSFIKKENNLIVSPFDSRFVTNFDVSERFKTVKGSEKGFRRDGIFRLTENSGFVSSLFGSGQHNNGQQQSVEQSVNAKSATVQQVMPNTLIGQTGISKDGTTYVNPSDGDILDPLRAYMTDAEYSKIRPYFNTDVRGKKIDKIPHIDTAIAVLDYMRNNGIEYSLIPDTRNGQIKCRLTGTKMDVRLVDVSDLENGSDKYVGRIYEEGISYYYKNLNANNRTSHISFVPDTRQVIDLIRYARGESVACFDDPNSNMGAIKIRNGGRRYGSKFGSYWTGKTVVGSHDKTSFTAYAGKYNDITFGIQKTGDVAQSPIIDEDTAIDYIKKAIESARVNFRQDLRIDDVIAKAYDQQNNIEDESYEYPYSSNSQVRALQTEYYNYILGVRDVQLTHPDGTSYQDVIDEISEHVETDEVLKAEVINRHASEHIDYLFGSFSDDDSFNPANVAEFMSSEYGVYHNNDELVNALRILDYPPEKLKGADNNFYNNTFINKLIKFDASTARPMKGISPFMDSMFTKIKNSILETGCKVNDNDIVIDNNGIVQYKAMQAHGVYDTSKYREITGQIGQIFEPDGKGLVETKFFGKDMNYLFVPGYEAYVVPQVEGENKTMEERTRLKGYEQCMLESIGHQIRRDLIAPVSPLGTGTPTSLNNTYGRLYVERFPINYMDYMRNTTEQAALTDARIKTLKGRVRYSNELRDGSTINAEYRANHGLMDDAIDNRDPYKLTGTNMSLITNNSNGYFDPNATSTSVNQGIVRYLVESAKVNPDGSIVKGDEDDRTPLLKMPMCQYMTHYNAGDRVTMTFNNLISGLDVGPAKTACMSFGGWTFDDGYVVSKSFAEKRSLPNIDGNGGRPLAVGDKISDLNGNKGVISLVVDPDMSDAEADEKGILDVVKWFRANPELDVVGAPYAGVSRFNGGSAREAIANHFDLKTPDGETLKGSMGQMYFLTSNMTVGEKTHTYGLDAVMVGKGRRVSGQAGWALQSKDARAIAKEFFGPNDGALMRTREMLITMGLDVDELGNLRVGYAPHPGEDRREFLLPNTDDIMSLKENKDKDGNVVSSYYRRDRAKFNSHEHFMQTVGRHGGVMEIPFSIKFPSGETTSPMNGGKTYGLPIMSASLRSGQEFADDGVSTVHDYTREYMHIYENSLEWQILQRRIDEKQFDSKNYPNEEALMRQQKILEKDAQASYDVITNDLSRRKFEGKHNIARDELMARRLPNSATAVWTANPTLDLDEIAMNTEMAKTLGAMNGNGEIVNKHIMVWRDPLLRDSGMRFMRVKIDDSLVGVAVNPVVDKSFDGDFDGDTVALVGLHKKSAINEAYNKFSMEANLLDLGSKDEETGEYKLAYHIDGLDLAGPLSHNENFSGRQAAIQKKANEIYKNEDMSDKSKMRAYAGLLELQSDLTHEVFESSIGAHVLSFDGIENHLKSLATMVNDGAKGSMKKLQDYAKYLGAEVELTDDGENVKSVIDLHQSGATRDDIINTQVATSVKSLGTGIAGSYSQRAVVAFRNQAMQAALELTYPVTQSVLQSKHNPDEARQKYNLMMGPVRHLWRGHKLEECHTVEDGNTWRPVKNENKEFVQATPEEFKQQFIDIYTKPFGLNVSINKDYVEDITKVLTNPETGKIMSVEDEARDKYACTLDRLSYGGTFDTWCDMAKAGRCIYDKDSIFAPSSVTRNTYIDYYGLDDEVFGNNREKKSVVMVKDSMSKTMLSDIKAKKAEHAKAMNSALSAVSERQTIDVTNIASNKSDGHGDLGE